MTSPNDGTRHLQEPTARSLIGKPILEAWVPVAMAEEGPGRQVLKAEPIEGHSKVLVHVVHVPADVDREALQGGLEGFRRVRHPNVLRVLMDGWVGPNTLVVVTPSTGATPWATRLVTRPPTATESIRTMLQVCRALAAIHAQGRGYGPLTPEHALVAPGPAGDDEVFLLPTWYCWRHGLDAREAAPWEPPEGQGTAPHTGAGERAADAWRLGALLWHSLVGAPPPRLRGPGSSSPGAWPDAGPSSGPPSLTSRLRRPMPEQLDGILAALLHPDPLARPIELQIVGDRLEEVVHHLEGGGPRIGPPMLVGTPIPVGNQLREHSLVARRRGEAPPPVAPPTESGLGPSTTAEVHPTPPAEEAVDTLDIPSPHPPQRQVFSAVHPARTPEEPIQAPPPAAPRDGIRLLVVVLACTGLAGVALILALYLAGIVA